MQPRVLFSQAEARAVVLDLRAGQELGEHSVRETAILQVVSGTVDIGYGGASMSCEAGTLVMFEPEQRHSVSARSDARLLLLLAPWPADSHYTSDETSDPDRIPSGIQAEPIESD
jgi:quercetin dioxygenase-like cupin family protein